MIAKSKKQKGYVAVLTLILFSALGLSLFAVFNSGQIVTHKLSLQNAVDAASYSSANIVAREMNYMAYTNRAMVANQLAIGQFVGALSWGREIQESVGTLETVGDILTATGYLSFIGVPLSRVAGAIESVIEGVLDGADSILKNTVLSNYPLVSEQSNIWALSNSQKLLHEATRLFMVRKVFESVLQDNIIDRKTVDSTAFLSSVSIISDLGDLMERSKAPGGSDMTEYDEFERIMRDSSDNFVFDRSRGWGGVTVWPFRVAFDKRGGNELKRDSDDKAWEWSAMDTVGFNLKRKKYGFFGGWKTMASLPVGWGAAHASADSSYNYNYYDWSQRNVNLLSIPLAMSDYGDHQVGKESKIRKYYHFKKNTKKTTDIVEGPEFIAMVSKAEKDVRTRNEMIADHTGNTVPVDASFNIEQEGNMSDGKLYAVTKVQVYFSRPPDGKFARKDKKQEFGNLFNPYWQVRLIDYKPSEVVASKILLDRF